MSVFSIACISVNIVQIYNLLVTAKVQRNPDMTKFILLFF